MVCAERINSYVITITGKHTMSDLRHDDTVHPSLTKISGISPNGSAYSVFGDADKTLIFIHGVGMNQQVWQPQIEWFSKRFRVVVYDLLGHGCSPMPCKQAQLSEYCSQLNALYDDLDIQDAVLIGHSTGALISVEFALNHPEKVISLIPMNIVYRRDQAMRKAVLGRANRVLQDNQIHGINVTLDRWFSSKTDPQKMEKIQCIRQFLEDADPVGYGRTYRMFAQSDEAFVGRLHQLKLPVLYLTGEADPNSTPQMSMQMAQDSPRGQVKTVNEEAHMMAYISPEKVNPIIEEFIDAH